VQDATECAGESIRVGPKRRGMRLVLLRPSLAALALRLGAVIASAAGITPLAAWAAPEQTQASVAPKIYHKGRNFRIPFNLHDAGKDRVKELRLLVSEDLGYHWDFKSKTFPGHPTFTFRSAHDGEYWFAVQTLTLDGKVAPSLDAIVEPNMKVVVDTFPPTILLEPEERRGSTASVRWEVKDENLDLKTLVLEYQVDGAAAWRRVPIRKPKLIGAQQWDAGTAEAVKVRASVADKAGNVGEAMIELPEGTGNLPELASSDAGEEVPPALAQVSNDLNSDISAGPSFTPVNQSPAQSRKVQSGTGRTGRTSAGRSSASVARGARPAGFDWDRGTGSPTAARPTLPKDDAARTDLFAAAGGPAPFASVGGSAGDSAQPRPQAFGQSGGDEGSGGTLLVANPMFKLQYAVEDAGPNGPATVELWITKDGGRTWIRRADDPDRVSPVEVDLGGEGTYGLYLVARSASGLGDQPPAPGDPPQSWIEVDATAPVVQLQPPQIGTGVNSGKVAIAWRASDLHIPPKAVSIAWRPDQPGAEWQTIADAQENAGQYIWTVPATAPERFHLKVEATDSVGHRGSADTTEMGAVTVDRSRPRSRIIGLDPNARAGIGPSARPLS
jgi:hypothetical protein